MALWVSETCDRCQREYGTTAKSSQEQYLKLHKHVCGGCCKKENDDQIARYKAKYEIFPSDIRLRLVVEVLQKLAIEEVGELQFYKMIADLIE